MSVGISRKTGEILFIKNQSIDMLEGSACAGIVDKVSGAAFKDADMLIGKSKVVSDDNSSRLTVQKAYGQDYSVLCKYTIDKDSFRIDYEVSCPSLSPREVNIDFNFPLASQRFEKVFWPMVGAPFSVRNPGVPKLLYRYGILVPEASVYNSVSDLGMSLVAPIDLPKPGFAYEWLGEYPHNTMSAQYFYLACGGKKTAKASIYILCHEGDWRSGMGWMVEKYPSYFRASGKGVPKGEGPMSILYSTTSDDTALDYAAKGIKWLEYQYCFPFYGMYAPKSDSWNVIADSDKVSLADWEKNDKLYGAQFNKSIMENKIDIAHKSGIAVYLYYQIADVWHQYADKYYSEDVARDEKNEPLPAFTLCRLMNSDPSLKWGNDIRVQLNDMLKDYKGIDGILWDELFYVNFDFAHDDGISMQGTRPCYQLAFATEKALVDIAPIVHKKGLGIWGNVASSVEVIKGVDGLLMECPDSYAETMQYLTIAKPMCLLAYDKNAKEAESKLKRCLLFGAFPSITEEQFPRDNESRRLEKCYKPMIDLFEGREWVLSAHALKLPDSVRGNIFKNAKNNYLVTVVSQDASQIDNSPRIVTQVPVTISIADASKIKSCYLLNSEQEGPTTIPFTRGIGNRISAVIPVHNVASMLVFSRQ
jgi:hypothetical protein